MAKGGFDGMIDSINNRDADDPVGMKSKKKEIKEKNPTQKYGGGFDSMIDNIAARDKDDPIGTKKKNKEKAAEKETKKKKSGGFDGIIDSIQDRDADDPTGTKPKKKEKKTEKEENGEKESKDSKESPLKEASRAVGDMLGIGVASTVGMGVVRGVSGVLTPKK